MQKGEIKKIKFSNDKLESSLVRKHYPVNGNGGFWI